MRMDDQQVWEGSRLESFRICHQLEVSSSETHLCEKGLLLWLPNNLCIDKNAYPRDMYYLWGNFVAFYKHFSIWSLKNEVYLSDYYYSYLIV